MTTSILCEISKLMLFKEFFIEIFYWDLNITMIKTKSKNKKKIIKI
jgi:hypothetical protein